jgi:hypothetical protein
MIIKGITRPALTIGIFTAVVVILLALILQVSVDPPVTNPKNVPVLIVLPIWFLAAIIIVAMPTKAVAFSVGLFTGGATSNIFTSWITDVADYILIPTTLDHYCNLPDLAIVFGVFLMIATVIKEIFWPSIDYQAEKDLNAS